MLVVVIWLNGRCCNGWKLGLGLELGCKSSYLSAVGGH